MKKAIGTNVPAYGQTDNRQMQQIDPKVHKQSTDFILHILVPTFQFILFLQGVKDCG